jgi:hypothetical protein
MNLILLFGHVYVDTFHCAVLDGIVEGLLQNSKETNADFER